MNLFERAIAALSPSWAVHRAQHRSLLRAYYEAVKINRLRRARTKDGTGDQAVAGNAAKLRAYARDLERNHDISRGAINTLVNNIVGPAGLAAEPQPRTKTGEIHEVFARQVLTLWNNWAKRPEVTWQYDWPAAQRIMCRAWMRDGESFAQQLAGQVSGLDHGTKVPFSLELLESDSLPLDYYDEGRRIVQGVERNGWGRPVGYWLYKTDPARIASLTTLADLKRVPAERLLHVKLTDRMLQARGVSVFASVLARLDDVKDYEDSERIAAKVAASMAAFIKKGVPDNYAAPLNEDGSTPEPRQIKFRPGMVFDDLLPGESIDVVDAKRPNPNVETFRSGQLRAASAGIGISYSSFSRSFDGSWSSQRQELVEQWPAYGVLQSEFGARIVKPVYEQFLSVAIAAGLLKIPADLDLDTLDDVILIGPQMPWIDPEKEANAWEKLENAGYASGPEIIRRRGQNPRDVVEQEANWKKLREERGLTSAPAPPPPTAADQVQQTATTAMAALRALGERTVEKLSAVVSGQHAAHGSTLQALAAHRAQEPPPVVNVTVPPAEAPVVNVTVPQPTSIEKNIVRDENLEVTHIHEQRKYQE